MKLNTKAYQFIKQIHLYASLTTVVFFGMYLISSFIMMHHDTFEFKEVSHTTENIGITPEMVDGNSWDLFLESKGVHGRLEVERTNDKGEVIRRYEAPEIHFVFTIAPDKRSLTFEKITWNANAIMNELHRLRGFKGPLTFWIYALMIDITAIALILFVLTGIILWLSVLKDKWIGWLVLALGAVYVGVVMGYMM